MYSSAATQHQTVRVIELHRGEPTLLVSFGPGCVLWHRGIDWHKIDARPEGWLAQGVPDPRAGVLEKVPEALRVVG